ncbi:MAG: hypothetical protein IJ804_07260 [Prevotella sp.]|nr:hypothetical protein [Prevotella sp.]
MKTNRQTILAAMAMLLLTAVPQQTSAQFLKKLGKALEKSAKEIVTGVSKSTSVRTTGEIVFPVTLNGFASGGAPNPNVNMVMKECVRNGNDVHVTYLATNNNSKDIRVSILASSLDEKWTIAYDANGKKHRTDFVYNDETFNTKISGFVDITLPHGIQTSILMVIKDVDQTITQMSRVSIAFNHYMYSLDNVPIAEPTVAIQPQPGAVQEFVLANGKLGPVQVGRPIGTLPRQVSGLYDKYAYKKEVHESDMDDPWTEEYYLFTKNGKNVFRANIDGGKVYSIRLLEASSFIKTPAGLYVGYPASKLFQQKRMTWEYYLYEAETWATDGHYVYSVRANDANTRNDEVVTGFKPDAKVIGISYVSQPNK